MGKIFDLNKWAKQKQIHFRGIQNLLNFKHNIITNGNDKHMDKKLELINERLHELSHCEGDSYGFSCSEEDDDSTISEITLPKAVAHENELVQRVIQDLGRPAALEYTVILDCIGRGDLLYIDPEIAIVIECKRVIGRGSSHSKLVVDQAIKYANVLAIVRPDLTVYGLTYTEYGYTIVEVIGEPRFPEKFAQLLDSAPIRV